MNYLNVDLWNNEIGDSGFEELFNNINDRNGEIILDVRNNLSISENGINLMNEYNLT